MEGEFTAGLVLVATALAVVPLLGALADRVVPRPPAFFARWGFSHVLLCILVGLTSALLLALVPGTRGFALLAKGVVTTGAMVAFAAWIAHGKHPEGIAALGLVRGGNGRAIFLGVASLVLLAPAYGGVLLLWPPLAEALGIRLEEQQHVLVEILSLEGSRLFPAALLIAVVVQPFLEEVLFRGFLQPLLVQNLHAGGGIVVTSLLFARLHGLPAMLPIFVLSLVLGWVQLRTGRLAAAWVLHGLNNGLMLAIGLHG